ncbi:MAG: FAD-dependent oxidoreductase [Lentisphaeria bacterium]|nr:FAD-dependent oxidoreductase [Lentisphaeria bacterium]
MNSITYQKQVPVRLQVDIFIAGGGPAGIAAALAAVREGRSVFLAEGQACLGGMGTAGLVPAFMTFGDGVNFLADGIGREVLDQLTREKGTQHPTHVNSIPAELLKRVYDRMLVQSGVQFSFHTQVVDILCNGSHLETAVCNGKSGFFAVKAKQFIDATGDGDLSVWAGAPFEKGDKDGNMMPGTLCSLWAGVDFDHYAASGISPRSKLQEAFDKGVFSVHDRHHPGMWRVGKQVTGGNIGHAFGVDATDERSLTKFLLEGRERLTEFERFYREYIPGFQNLELVGSGALMGIRESRRILGDYVLNVEDFRKRAVFADEIGRYCYPVDIHPYRPSTETYAAFEKEYHETLRYQQGESYGIPYRCLTPQKTDNLLVSGRCISTDQKIQGSVRVMPGCYITGQAAGMAAVLCCEQNCDTRSIAIPALHRRLKKIGAFLPNAE